MYSEKRMNCKAGRNSTLTPTAPEAQKQNIMTFRSTARLVTNFDCHRKKKQAAEDKESFDKMQ